MSIDTVNDLPRRNQYVAAASQTVFDYTFPIFADADLVVYVDDVLQALNTDYTVAGATEDAGGEITFITPLAGGEIVVIYSDLAIERTTDFQQNGPLASANFNDQLDRLTLIARELKDRIGRAIRWPVKHAESSDDLELNLTNYSSRYLYVNASGELEPAANLTTTTLTQSVIGGLLYPETAHETAELITPADKAFRAGEDPRYSTLANSITASKGPFYEVKLAEGTRTVAAPITIDESVVISGVGINSGCTAGSIIDTSGDVSAFIVSAASVAAQRTVFRDFGILHGGATKPAIQFNLGAAYGQIDNVVINCESVGHTGVLVGDTNTTTLAEAWQFTANNLRVDDAITYGIRINTTGHTVELRNCSIRTAVAGAHAAYINSRNVHIYGGQYGGNGAGSIGIYFHNISASAHARGSVNDVVFETIATGEYAIVIDGTSFGFNKVHIDRIGSNLSTSQGTIVKFGRTSDSVFSNPNMLAPTGGGKLCEWGEFSQDCMLVCDFDNSRAAITVHGSATRALKVVTGRIPLASVVNITTAANLTTILRDGIIEIPNIIPRHNGVSWNYVPAAPAQITVNTDNYTFTGIGHNITVRLSTDASRNLTGIVAQSGGTRHTLCNVGAFDLVLVHDATSTAANRFLCPGSANYTLNANDSVTIEYDSTSSRWRVLAA